MTVDSQNFQKGHKHIDRRFFLKNLAALGASILIGGCRRLPPITLDESHAVPSPNMTQKTPEVSLQSVDDKIEENQEVVDSVALKREIEGKYNISIMGIKAGMEMVGGKYEPDSKFPDVPLEWDVMRLQILDKSLSILPSHFYKPDYRGNRLIFLLGKQTTVGMFSSIPKIPHLVELDYKRFRLGNEKRSTMDVAHELVHIITPVDWVREQYQNANDGSQALRLVQLSPWYDQVESILGKKYLDFAPPMWEEVKRRQNYIWKNNEGWVRDPKIPVEQSPEQQERDKFAIHFGYTLRHQDYDEFIAVLGETFILGRDYFVKMFADYLGKETAEKLFQFTKKTIFRMD